MQRRGLHDLLYATGARLGELCAAELDDVMDSHILLRRPKLRPGGIAPGRPSPIGRGRTLNIQCWDLPYDADVSGER